MSRVARVLDFGHSHFTEIGGSHRWGPMTSADHLAAISSEGSRLLDFARRDPSDWFAETLPAMVNALGRADTGAEAFKPPSGSRHRQP